MVSFDYWIEDDSDLWVNYAVKMTEELNDRLMKSVKRPIKHFTLINERNMFALGTVLSDFTPTTKRGGGLIKKAYDGIFSSYVKAYDGIYDLYENRGWGSPDIFYNSASTATYESDKQIMDIMRLRTFGIERSDIQEKFTEFREAWYKRIDAVAGKVLTKEEFEGHETLKGMAKQLIKPNRLKKNT